MEDLTVCMKDKDLVSIIYYTSNQEKLGFEQRIKDNVRKVCGDLPIISVSQKPIENFGTNIVVGDVGASGFNMFRQVQIACEEAKTRFVISAEADCLYPPDYFQFIPERDDRCYRNSNLYVMGHKRDYFWRKGDINNSRSGATHAQIVGRGFYLKKLRELFKGAPKWSVEEKNFPKELWHFQDVFSRVILWESENPVVQIKTSESMRHYTCSDRIDRAEIPYWGSGKLFRQKYFEGK